MRSQTKAKVEVRRVNLDLSHEAPVVLCLLALGTNFASFGRRGSVTVVVIVLFSIRRSLQLRLQKTTGVGRVRTRGSRRRVTVPGHRSRFQLLEGLSESQGQRGKTIFLRFSCSLPAARSDDGRSDQPFDQHSSRAGKLRLHPVSQPAFCNASYTQPHRFIWEQH